MKKSFSLSLFFMFISGFFMGHVHAQSNSSLGRPVAPPTSLPPLPQDIYFSLSSAKSSSISLENTSKPSSPESSLSIEQQLTHMFQTEIDRLNQVLTPNFTLVFLPMDQDGYKQFVAQGLLKLDMEHFKSYETGLSGLMVKSSYMNNRKKDMCYILYDSHYAESLWKMFVVPLNTHNDTHTAAAWLIAHETGHCFDQWERENMILLKSTWTPHEAFVLGLWPPSTQNIYGSSFNKYTYLQNPQALSQNSAQQQFQERVADSFATLWTLKMGSDPKLIADIASIRSQLAFTDPHYTTPVFPLISQNYTYALNQNRLDQLWKIAREIQQKVGVDPHIKETTDSVNSSTSSSILSEQPHQPSPQRQTPRNFNDIPRFGSK